MTSTRSIHDDELDSFETALLAELRGVVDGRRPIRRKRVLTLGGVAAAGVTAVGLSLTLGGTSPAFAVHREADGDIVVTIHRLTDAAGLEHALADQGVVADVDYADPIQMRTTDGRTLNVIPLPGGGSKSGDGADPDHQPLAPVDCHFGEGGNLTLTRSGDDYRITIPRASVLAHTPLHILSVLTPQEASAGEPKAAHATLAISYDPTAPKTFRVGQCVQVASAG